MGNLGNQMIQYLAAAALASLVPGSVLSNVQLPAWHVSHPYLQGDFPRTEIVTTDRMELERLAEALNGGLLQRVDLRSYAQRMENFPPLARARLLLPFALTGESATARDDELLCNLRQGDILDAHHPDYVLIPAEFYAELAALTGKRLLFMGQTEASPYMNELRSRFPDARILPSQGAVGDFEAIRRARHIVPSISTFGWLAAWLSEAEQIHMPVLGLLHPRQSRGTNLLPLDDPRFRFHLFPYHYAVPVERVASAHADLRGLWRLMESRRLADLIAKPPPPRRRDRYCEAFDEQFYLATYPDIAQAVAGGHLPSGRHHYEFYGFAEGREAFPLDRAWYCSAYPIAAIELSQGDFLDPPQHWLEIGRSRGYRRSAATAASDAHSAPMTGSHISASV